jgi:uncharacterized protein YjlB
MANIISEILKDDGTFPNNAKLPLVLYRNVVEPTRCDPASAFETLFTQHQWPAAWRNGIFSFHHYHSTAHEVLGIYAGEAEVQMGGEQGIIVTIGCGDVVVIPAGVAHKKLRSSRDFAVVGGYPTAQHPDTCYGKPGERPQVDRNIARVALPHADPVFGAIGPVIEQWQQTAISTV